MALNEGYLIPSGTAKRRAIVVNVAGEKRFVEVVAIDPAVMDEMATTSDAASKITPSAIANEGTVGVNADLGGTRMVGFTIGGTWTAAPLSWEVSLDGVTWVPLKDPATNNLIAYTVSANGGYPVDPYLFMPWRYVRPKSSVNQTGGATVTISSRVL